MYVPSEQLQQVEKKIRAEFKHVITSFESFYEDEFTSIIVELGKMAGHIEVEQRCIQIVNSVIGDEYIVSLLIRPIESIDQPTDLFNLTYSGASNNFLIDYYAPEYARLSCPSGKNHFRTTIYYTKMIKALRTIHFDSPSELWSRLFRPIKEILAQRRGVHSFCKDLAPDLRDFLVEHLDFIERMIEASGETLQVLPAPITLLPPSPLANGRKPSLARQHAATSQQELALPTAVAA